MLTVTCVLKSGGRYNRGWVVKLKKMVERHLPVPHEFVCFSDVDVPCHRIPLRRNWPGWWSKMEMYESLTSGPVLYFDLDTLIVGDISSLSRTSPGFTMVSDFYHPTMGNSCCLSWEGDYSRLTEAFAADPIGNRTKWDRAPGALIGDQGFIHKELRAVDWFDTSKVVSYKKDCRQGKPENASVICFHGKPKPSESAAGWAYKEWTAI